MVRMIAFGLLCIIALPLYCLLRKRLQKILQGIDCTEVKPNMGERGTLVKDPYTGEYDVK
ncbi:hypothetical protein LBE40_05520 [Bartonella taylorii]|uniref:Uncharacterized protein n=1 Tax=Bartonella taylorii 8TBB TaxID=1094560 RepID=A0A9P2W274_BARTA|nr:hypothetical protein [Bartonella taylorii]EJF93000.1 hypothetical protein ME9_01442 [Bartonella taylorii 8TBB]USP00757.1 hypothetical protein LBE40_05520 [Bartonella taylorii]